MSMVLLCTFQLIYAGPQEFPIYLFIYLFFFLLIFNEHTTLRLNWYKRVFQWLPVSRHYSLFGFCVTVNKERDICDN